MSTQKELQNIIRRLKQRMAEAEKFNRNLKKEISEIDSKLETLKRKKKH